MLRKINSEGLVFIPITSLEQSRSKTFHFTHNKSFHLPHPKPQNIFLPQKLSCSQAHERQGRAGWCPLLMAVSFPAPLCSCCLRTPLLQPWLCLTLCIHGQSDIFPSLHGMQNEMGFLLSIFETSKEVLSMRIAHVDPTARQGEEYSN